MPPRAPLRTGQLHHEPENTNDVFDPPNLTTDGDDAPARHPTLQRLWRQGTEKRRLMEEGQSFTVAVQFKIHTNNRVDVPPAHPNPVPKLTTRKKEAPPVPTFAVIDSSTFKNNRVLESRAFLYGKSLNEFKDLIGDICDKYKKGTKRVVLDSPKLHLVDYQSYQQFVDNLGKSCTRKGVINITLENPQAKAKQDAQASGGVAYIKGLNGPSSIEEELVASKEETAAARQETMEVKVAKALELEASTIYSKHLEQALGGDGTILAAPWDPNYFYCFTHRCAFLWAKAIRDGYTTRAIPPSTSDYKKEMAKNAVNHQEASVDYRVKKQYPVPIPSPRSPRRSTSNAIQMHCSFFANAPFKVKEEPESPRGSKRHVKQSSLGSVTSLKKMKQESPPGNTPIASQSNTISLLTSDDIPEADVYESDSDVKVVQNHATLLEDFLGECDIPVDNQATRVALGKAKVGSWTELIPSQQMTANVLTTAGMSFEVAKRLINAAKEADAQFQRTTNRK
ncbi:hypothetical protein DFH28DRAFT_1081239 [Melampsora americana]|nr:hypothetical protein DFH28DRAFT_1081239 [Melampsora americana]